MVPVNRQLQNKLLQHAIEILRLSKGEASKIVRLLDKTVYREIVYKYQQQLLRVKRLGSLSSYAESQRLKEMMYSIQSIMKIGMEKAYAQTRSSLTSIAEFEGRWNYKVLKKLVEPFDINFSMPSVSTLRSIVVTKPFEGDILKNWFSKLDKSVGIRIGEQLNIGIVQGEAVPTIARRLETVLDYSRRNTTSIVRTAVNSISTEARLLVNQENGDVIEGEQIIATLDARTTPLCRAMDGKVYPIGVGPRPPFHWNCRTTVAPVLKSWKQLGIKLSEAPEGTRASMDGQVPDRVTYQQWLKGLSAEEQDDILGPNKGKMFRQGMKVTAFVDADFQPLTLDELQRRES